MALTSPVSICNLALAHLGQPAITNIEIPTTREEIVCSKFYDIARQTLYRDCFFQFSIGLISLPEDSSTPAFMFSKQSTELPQDFISLMYLSSGNSILTNNGNNYRLFSNRIMSNLSAPYNVVYIKDIKDCSKMTYEYKMLLSFYLAFLMTESLGSSADKKSYVSQMYLQLLAKARYNNGQDNIPIRVNNSNYIDEYTGITGSQNETYFK